MAYVEQLGPEEDEDEQVKAYPMANGGRKHLTWMLQGLIRRLFIRENWARVLLARLGRFDGAFYG